MLTLIVQVLFSVKVEDVKPWTTLIEMQGNYQTWFDAYERDRKSVV